MIEDRVALFRKRALDAESKAFNARTDEIKRAWLIVARDWTKMAEREAVRNGADALIRQFSEKSVPPARDKIEWAKMRRTELRPLSDRWRWSEHRARRADETMIFIRSGTGNVPDAAAVARAFRLGKPGHFESVATVDVISKP